MARKMRLYTSLVAVLTFLTAVTNSEETSKCAVIVNDFEYDLSSLATQDNWKVDVIGHEETTIYLSLCHPLRNVPNGCGGNDTGVCITQTTTTGLLNITVPNAGRVSPIGPTVPLGQTMIGYIMEDGAPCPMVPGARYRTSINFICTNAPEEETGPVLMSSHRCELLFAWMTQAACPRRLDKLENTKCTLKFPSSDHNLHLQTLRTETFYSSTSSTGSYEVNICGNVVNGSCIGSDVAVCYKPNGKEEKPEILATTSNLKVQWEDGNVNLIYQSNDTEKSVILKFTCDRYAADLKVNYATQNVTSLTLVARTSAVCPPKVTPTCVLDDHSGNVYDLRPLHRVQDNWEVLQSSKDGRDILYHVNICGPVNPSTPYTCPSGLIGACKAGVGTDASYNLGLLTSNPTINKEDNSITVFYSGGDPCKGGEHTYSTRINLICDPDEQGPTLVKSTNTCEYVFDWLTPAACPRHTTKGTNCRVTDSLYGNVFDLNSLRNVNRDYVVSSDSEKFYINLCGPIVSSCNGKNGTAGVCEIGNGREMNAGNYTSELTFNDGTLMMSFEDGETGCEGNGTRASQIIFLCDHELSGRDGPVFFGQHGCINSFVWKTREACPPFHTVDCTLYTPEGIKYDLTELSSSDTNLEYYSSDGKKFVFNVCRSIIHQKGSRCPYRASACITDRTHHNTSINIGELESGPYLKDGRLMIKYTGGDECKGPEQSYQTVIEFKCDEEELFSFPQFVAQENCTYYFEVRSAVACPIHVQNSSLLQVGRECTVTSPSGYTFSLNPLKKESGYKVRNSKNIDMTINVCDELKHSECTGNNIGVCSSSGSGGEANDRLNYLPEHLSLHYTGGEKCSENVNRSSVITFVCGAENTTEGPVLVFDDQEQCVYFITWYTELACEKRIPCYVDTLTHQIDLSPLINSHGNYEAVNPKNQSEKFYLNVCRPLNPIAGINCRPGSAICRVVDGELPVSLGHPRVTPVYDGSGGARIMYTHGARCPTVPDYDLTSMVHFVCDPTAGKGHPVYKKRTHDCQYQFEWLTSVACDSTPKIEESGPQCQIRFDDAKANIDLKPLYRPEGYQVLSGNKTFTLNVCGSACNTSGCCTSDGDSYGLSSKSELQWSYGKLSLRYYGGSKCNESLSGHKATSIHFDCDMSAGFGFPVADKLMASLNCLAIFTWKTNVTCIEGIYATELTPPLNVTFVNTTTPSEQLTPSPDSQSATVTTQTSTATVISAVLVVSVIVVVLTLFFTKTRRGYHMLMSARQRINFKFSNARHSHIENSTLLGNTSSIRVFRVEDSDEDMLRV